MKALFEAGVLPAIISGSSAGALVGSMICTRTDAELPAVFKPEVESVVATACGESVVVKVGRLLRTGFMFDDLQWREKMKVVTCGDTTFREASSTITFKLNLTFNQALTQAFTQILALPHH